MSYYPPPGYPQLQQFLRPTNFAQNQNQQNFPTTAANSTNPANSQQQFVTQGQPMQYPVGGYPGFPYVTSIQAKQSVESNKTENSASNSFRPNLSTAYQDMTRLTGIALQQNLGNFAETGNPQGGNQFASFTKESAAKLTHLLEAFKNAQSSFGQQQSSSSTTLTKNQSAPSSSIPPGFVPVSKIPTYPPDAEETSARLEQKNGKKTTGNVSHANVQIGTKIVSPTAAASKNLSKEEMAIISQRDMMKTQLKELEARKLAKDELLRNLNLDWNRLKKEQEAIFAHAQQQSFLDENGHRLLNLNSESQNDRLKQIGVETEAKASLEKTINNFNEKLKEFDNQLNRVDAGKKDVRRSRFDVSQSKSEVKHERNEKKGDSLLEKRDRNEGKSSSAKDSGRRAEKKEESTKKEQERRRGEEEKEKQRKEEKRKDEPEKQRRSEKETSPTYEYVDRGSHWCPKCHVDCLNILDYCKHLHQPEHKNATDFLDRPWLPEHLKYTTNRSDVPLKTVGALPIKGVEFMYGCSAFYCSLCREFSGDVICVEDHLKSALHNKNYAKYVKENKEYEGKFKLERMKFLMESIESASSQNIVSSDFVHSIANVVGSTVPQKSVGKVEPFRVESKDEQQNKANNPGAGSFRPITFNFAQASNTGNAGGGFAANQQLNAQLRNLVEQHYADGGIFGQTQQKQQTQQHQQQQQSSAAPPQFGVKTEFASLGSAKKEQRQKSRSRSQEPVVAKSRSRSRSRNRRRSRSKSTDRQRRRRSRSQEKNARRR